MPQAFGVIISRGMAKMHELQTFYGNEDFYNLLEIIAVDDHNRMLAQKAAK